MSDEHDAINPDYARENPSWRKTGAADLPASLREAIEREAEQAADQAWPAAVVVDDALHRWLIAYGERIARLTLEAERQRPIYVGVDLASGPDYVAHPPVPQCGVAGPHPSNECGVGR